MSPEEAWWDEMLAVGRSPLHFADRDAWADGTVTIEPHVLHASYLDYVSRHRLHRAKGVPALAMAIRKKAGIDRRQINRDWFWVIPQLDEARETWAKWTGRTG